MVFVYGVELYDLERKRQVTRCVRWYYLYRCERSLQETSSLLFGHPSTLISNNPNLCSSPNVRYQVSHPYIVL